MPELTDSLLQEVLHAFQPKGLSDWLARWAGASAHNRIEMIHALRNMP